MPRAKREEINLLLKRIVESAKPVRFLQMCRFYRAFSFLGLKVCFLQGMILLLLGFSAFPCGDHSQLVNNISLAQLTESLRRANQLVVNLSHRATVLTSSTNTGALILQDRTDPCEQSSAVAITSAQQFGCRFNCGSQVFGTRRKPGRTCLSMEPLRAENCADNWMNTSDIC